MSGQSVLQGYEGDSGSEMQVKKEGLGKPWSNDVPVVPMSAPIF